MPKKPKMTAEGLKKMKRTLRGPHRVTGRGRIVGGLTSTQLSDIRKLRSNRNSNLYTMNKQDFRGWFYRSHGYSYPYNIPKKRP